MKNIISDNVKNIEISGIRQYHEEVQKYPTAVSFIFGEPDFEVPRKITKAVADALISGKTTYTSNIGIKELRQEISRYLSLKNIEYSSEEICLTAGCTEGLICTFKAVINKGDKVLIPNPGFPSYLPMLNLCDASPIYYDLNDDFSINIEDLKSKISQFKPKALVLSFPLNPTGAILSKKDTENLYEVIKENNIIAISDEIYSEICFDEFHTPIQHNDIKDKFILVSGFSKMFSMTGLRVGYVCANKNIIQSVLKVHSYNVSCAPSISQWGALTGLRECMEDLENMKKEYLRRRNYVYKRLTDMGLEVTMPKGTFFIFPSIKKFGLTSEEFCNRLLREAEVAVIPGSAFGSRGEGHIRISYSTHMYNLEKGLNRLESWIKNNFKGD